MDKKKFEKKVSEIFKLESDIIKNCREHAWVHSNLFKLCIWHWWMQQLFPQYVERTGHLGLQHPFHCSCLGACCERCGDPYSGLWHAPLKKRPGSHLGRNRKTNIEEGFQQKSWRRDFKANPTLLCVRSLSLWQDPVSPLAVVKSSFQHAWIHRRGVVLGCTKSLSFCRSYKKLPYCLPKKCLSANILCKQGLQDPFLWHQ